MKKYGILIAFAVVIVAFVVGILLVRHNKTTKQSNDSNTAHFVTVQVTSNGFNPSTLIVNNGTTVSWLINDKVNAHGVSSAVQNQSGTNVLSLNDFGTKSNLSDGASYKYTFKSAGTLNYHDTTSPTHNGVIIVK